VIAPVHWPGICHLKLLRQWPIAFAACELKMSAFCLDFEIVNSFKKFTTLLMDFSILSVGLLNACDSLSSRLDAHMVACPLSEYKNVSYDVLFE